jgi:hypothetical protein
MSTYLELVYIRLQFRKLGLGNLIPRETAYRRGAGIESVCMLQ